MNLLDPTGTRSPSPFETLTKTGAARPVSSSVRDALAGSGYTNRPNLSTPKTSTTTPPGVTQPPAPSTPAAPAEPLSPFDPNADPVVQQIRAFGAKNVQQAQASELAGRKKTLIDYGYDPALQSLYPDQATADAAAQNPFSFLANAQHDYGQSAHNLDESLNRDNLFYSSYRGDQQGELARGYQQQLATGAGNLQGALGSLAAALMQAKLDAEQNDLAAQGDAYDRYTPPESPIGGTPSPADVAAALVSRASAPTPNIVGVPDAYGGVLAPPDAPSPLAAALAPAPDAQGLDPNLVAEVQANPSYYQLFEPDLYFMVFGRY